MKPIKDIKEKRKYFLNICDVIDECCRTNNIEYSLAYGTLIGAYRHGGFIPWDDDFDIMMTRENYDKFKQVFHHKRYKLETATNSRYHFIPFPRIVDSMTFSLSSKNLLKKRKKEQGISIDLYIVENLPDSTYEIDKLIKRLNLLKNLRKFFFRIKNLKVKLGFNNSFLISRYLAKEQEKTGNINNPSSKLKLTSVTYNKKEILNCEIFNDYQDCKFEDRNYRTIVKYDDYLTTIFGDWRTPPPLDQCIPYHGGDFYSNE